MYVPICIICVYSLSSLFPPLHLQNITPSLRSKARREEESRRSVAHLWALFSLINHLFLLLLFPFHIHKTRSNMGTAWMRGTTRKLKQRRGGWLKTRMAEVTKSGCGGWQTQSQASDDNATVLSRWNQDPHICTHSREHKTSLTLT